MVMTSSLQGCVTLVTLYFCLTEKAVRYIDEVLAATTIDEIFETNSIFHAGTSFTWPRAIFSKILVLEKKSRSQHARQLAEKPFQAPKIIFKSPKLIVQKRLSYVRLLKDKRFKFTFLGEPTFQVLVRGSSPPKNIKKNKNKYFFLI